MSDGATADRGRLWSSVRVAVFVCFAALQGLFPLWALLADAAESRTDFTWDMFAVRRDCGACELSYRVGDAPSRRLSWGLAAPSIDSDRPRALGDQGVVGFLLAPPQISASARAAFEAFDANGRGAVLAHPEQPALNVRAAPQVGRLRTGTRLRWLREALCRDLAELYEDASTDPTLPAWARTEAAVWERAGRRLVVSVSCTCSYNQGEAVALVPESELVCSVPR